jgi:hypothetical protein
VIDEGSGGAQAGRGPDDADSAIAARAAALHRRWLDALCALAALSSETWADALAVLGPSSEGVEPDVLTARFTAAAPALTRHAPGLLDTAVKADQLTQSDPPRETAEMVASELWAELGGASSAVLADRLHALFTAPWVVHRAKATFNPRAGGPTGAMRRSDTPIALRLLAELPAGEWDAALAAIERSSDAPPHEVYARFAAAAPTLRWRYTHRLLHDLVYPPRGLPTEPWPRRADAFMATFARDPEPDRRRVLASRLQSLLSTEWILRRIAEP